MNQDDAADNGSRADTVERDAVSSRRAALQKLGVFGAVTAPALLAILHSDRAQAASPIGDPINGMCTVDPPSCTFF